MNWKFWKKKDESSHEVWFVKIKSEEVGFNENTKRKLLDDFVKDLERNSLGGNITIIPTDERINIERINMIKYE